MASSKSSGELSLNVILKWMNVADIGPRRMKIIRLTLKENNDFCIIHTSDKCT